MDGLRELGLSSSKKTYKHTQAISIKANIKTNKESMPLRIMFIQVAL